MRNLKNIQLTPNFSLYEMIEGKLPPEGVAMNWENIALVDLSRIQEAAEHAQLIRDLINQNFKSDTGKSEIGLQINSGWRCREWELYRNRSGESQHTIAAYDAVPVNCSLKQAAEIIAWLHYKHYRHYNGGLAMKKPKIKAGEIVSAGFIHFDFRGVKARWTY